jgi:hypothetical protein
MSMRLLSRLEQLERHLRTRECRVCEGMGPLVISYVIEDEPDPVPEGCPSCGRCTHLVVCFADEGIAPGQPARVRSDSTLTGPQMAELYSLYDGR